MSGIYYDFQYEDELFTLEDATPEAAEEWAQEWWANRCKQEPLKNGEVIEAVGWIVGGNLKRHSSAKKITLSYEHYHGDFAEHNTMRAGGSL